MSGELLQERYLSLREKLGRKPKFKEFLDEFEISKRVLERVFGRDAYSKLQEACGDTANKLDFKRITKDVIFTQYGELTRELGELPVAAEWSRKRYKPSDSGLSKPPHNILWSEMPQNFIEYFGSDPSWKDVIKIIKASLPDTDSTKPDAKNKEFDKVINTIQNWVPKRKRNSEEGYKIELREYLENNTKYSVSEETGESNADLVVNDKYAIELKKNPSLPEYDRLFGQIARHFNNYDYVIALICDVASDDRYRQFIRNIDEIYEKLNLNIYVLTK